MKQNHPSRTRRRPGIRILFPLIFSATILVCIISLIALFSQSVSKSIAENVQADRARQSASLSASIERELARMMDVANQAYYTAIKGVDFTGARIQDTLSVLYRQHSDALNGLFLYTDAGKLIWGSDAEEAANASPAADQQWFQDAQSNIELICFEKPQLCWKNGQLIRSMPVSRFVELTGSGNSEYGVLRLDFSMQILQSICKDYNSTIRDYCYILDENGNLLYHPFQKKIESGIWDEWSVHALDTADACLQTTHENKNWLIEKQQIGYTGWTLVMVSSLTDIKQANAGMFYALWLILCGVGAVMILMDLFILSQLTNPVAGLSDAMERFGQGKLETRVTETGIGELRVLASGFNSMAGRIEDLLDQILKHEQEKRHMERKLLQSQITPHFLYNTLDSIIWMIQSRKYEDAGKMVSLLAKFFRISLSQGKDIIPLRKELEHAVSYLSIQNIRFQNTFHFSVDVDESLLEYVCPKLSIQPLLENAVYHGVEGMYDEGEIIIRIYEAEQGICIDVTDNGAGMNEETIAYILHHDVVSSKRGSGIGVHNVDARIKLLYGEQYGITIISVLDEGTTARITIPKVGDAHET